MEATNEQIINALESFFEEDMELAEKAGYELTVGANEDGSKIYVDVDSTDDSLPTISVYPRSQEEGVWDFSVDVSFPDLNLDTMQGTMSSRLSSWVYAAYLADDLESIRFEYAEWAE